MSGEEPIEQDAYIKEQLSKWDRALLVVSIPHGAAFSAFLGRYDIGANTEGDAEIFVSVLALMAIAPLVTIWLFGAHNLLRNTFLRVGHFGRLNSLKSNIEFTVLFSLPIICVLLSFRYKAFVDARSIMLISATMFSWIFFLIIVANGIYVRIAKSLGVHLSE